MIEAPINFSHTSPAMPALLPLKRPFGGNQLPNHQPLKICIDHPPVSATYGNFMPCKLLMTNNLCAIGYVRCRTDLFQLCVYI